MSNKASTITFVILLALAIWGIGEFCRWLKRKSEKAIGEVIEARRKVKK